MKPLALICLVIGIASGCAYEQSHDIPEKVVKWAQENVWRVEVPGGTGSGFWVDQRRFVTACHVTETASEIAIHRVADNSRILMEQVSCSKEVDIAILKAVQGKPPQSPTRRGLIKIGAPIANVTQGKTVYGPGYPMGGSLVITHGHWNGLETTVPKEYYPDGVYTTTAPIIFGDSGSPLVALVNGEIVILGVRIAVRVNPIFTPFGALGIPITHMALISGADSLRKELG